MIKLILLVVLFAVLSQAHPPPPMEGYGMSDMSEAQQEVSLVIKGLNIQKLLTHTLYSFR